MPVAVQPTSKNGVWYAPASLWRSFTLRPRAMVGAALGFGALALLPGGWPASLREALAWDIGGLVYAILAFHTMTRRDVGAIREKAAQADESGVVILALILMAIISSFAAIVGLISHAKDAAPEQKALYIGLVVATILISWTVMQVTFSLHYAHAHYAPRNQRKDGGGGLEFPDDSEPDYWDFFYFATSFGAASQTSDVMIRAKNLRRIATLHAIVAFFFNTAVLALAINLAASLI